MKRFLAAVCLLGFLASSLWADLTVEGETVVVVTKLPFKINAPRGSKLYFWRLPAGWKTDSTLASPTVTVTEALEGAAIVQCDSVAADFTVTTHKLLVNIGKVPIPPEPDPGPTPPVPPSPGKGISRVLILFDPATLTKLPAAQQSILYGKATRDALNASTPLGPDGKTRQWRIWPADADASSVPVWKAMMDRPRASLPWVVIVDTKGIVSFEGALPADSKGMLDLIASKKGGRR